MPRLSVLLFAVLTSACALQTEHIDITYRPAQPPTPIPGAATKTVAVVAREGRKGDPQIISVKKNGYGMELGDLVANQPVLGTVKAAVEQELTGRGFRLSPGGAVVDIELERFYADYKMGFLVISAKSEVNMLVQVRDPAGQTLYTRIIGETSRPDGSLVGTPSLARESLDSALQAAVATLMQDPQFLSALQKAGPGMPVASLRVRTAPEG